MGFGLNNLHSKIFIGLHSIFDQIHGLDNQGCSTPGDRREKKVVSQRYFNHF